MKILLSKISVHKLRVSTKSFRPRKEQDGVVTTRIKTQYKNFLVQVSSLI